MESEELVIEKVLMALRRIMRSVDIHSRRLIHDFGITGPQLVVLKLIERLGTPSPGELARQANLSNATISGILDRLQRSDLLARTPSSTDRRRHQISLTRKGRMVLEQAPPPLQERFVARFRELHDWEQSQMLASLQRLAGFMDEGFKDPAPMLASEPLVEERQPGKETEEF